MSDRDRRLGSAARARNQARAGFLWRHLVGEYSLARSYWLHTVVLGWGLVLAGSLVLSSLADRTNARSVSMAVLVFEPFVLVVWAWSVFGTTISALRKLFAGPGRFWAVLALLVLALGTLATARQLKHLAPELKEHWDVAMGQQPGEPFKVELIRDGRVVSFSGGVQEGAAQAIDRVIGEAPNVGTLLIDSPGGWLREGKKMAAVVKRYRLNTRVENECFSACTLVLLAGENRSAGASAQIGFHRGRAVGESAEGRARPASIEEAELYRQAGLRDDFVRKIVSTPNQAIWIPSLAELQRADVLTR